MEKSLEAKKSESTICNCVAIGGVHSELYIKRVATVNESGYLVMVKEKLSSNKVEVFDYNKIKGDKFLSISSLLGIIDSLNPSKQCVARIYSILHNHDKDRVYIDSDGNIKLSGNNTIHSSSSCYFINSDRIHTIQDVINVIRIMNFSITKDYYNSMKPEQQKYFNKK